jgi:hypothetical protein
MCSLDSEKRNALLSKLRKLQEMKNFGTENEALLAAERITEILDKYDLTMSDIELGSTSSIGEDTINSGRTSFSHPMGGCIGAIGSFCDCRTWLSSRKDNTGLKYSVYFIFFGRKQDTEVAKYIYNIVLNAMERELKDFQGDEYYNSLDRGGKIRATNEFRHSMARHVSHRLVQMKKVRTCNVVEMTGRDIVLVKKEAVDKEFKKLNLRLSSNRGYVGGGDSFARGAGYKAGGRVAFHHGVSSGGHAVFAVQ